MEWRGAEADEHWKQSTPSHTHMECNMQWNYTERTHKAPTVLHSRGLVLLPSPGFGNPQCFSFISTTRSTCLNLSKVSLLGFFLFVFSFIVGIHSCLPQLGLWNFKMFSPRSTVILNFYLVQNFDISKIKRHLKNCGIALQRLSLWSVKQSATHKDASQILLWSAVIL